MVVSMWASRVGPRGGAGVRQSLIWCVQRTKSGLDRLPSLGSTTGGRDQQATPHAPAAANNPKKNSMITIAGMTPRIPHTKPAIAMPLPE